MSKTKMDWCDSTRKVTSAEIKEALALWHSNPRDYFITECKTGSTYFPPPQGLLKFDGLAITKSYTKPCIAGYEIKVSRGDFLQDPKWHLYLQYCNEFYFVVPTGLVKKEELPAEVGLIYYNAEKQTLKKVKKALYRDIEEPIGIYKYIVFSRLGQDRIPFYEDRAEYARDYLRDKKGKRSIGDVLGSKMAKELQESYQKLDELEQSREELENWKKVKNLLRKYNIMGWGWHRNDKWLEELEKAITSSYPKGLENVRDELQCLVEQLDRMKEKYNTTAGGYNG